MYQAMAAVVASVRLYVQIKSSVVRQLGEDAFSKRFDTSGVAYVVVAALTTIAKVIRIAIGIAVVDL